MAYGPAIKKKSQKPLITGIAIVGLLALLVIAGFFGYRYVKARSVKDPAGATIQPSQTNEVEVGVSDNQTPTPSPTTASSTPAAEQQASANSITISSPKEGAVIASGVKLEGVAPSGYRTVSYRLQSDDRGVVGQGTLSVVNNRFSGTVSSGGATGSGYIEVFVIDKDGREANHAKVGVTYK